MIWLSYHNKYVEMADLFFSILRQRLGRDALQDDTVTKIRRIEKIKYDRCLNQLFASNHELLQWPVVTQIQ